MPAEQKRAAIVEAEGKKKKRIKVIIIAIIVVILAVLIVKGICDSRYNGELRNFAVEEMDGHYTNVYADVVSVTPEYFIYSYYTTKYGRKIRQDTISKVVCKCQTVEGKTIFVSIFYSDYPGVSLLHRKEEYKPLEYPEGKRITGRVRTARQVDSELVKEIGNVFVLSAERPWENGNTP